ncbi:MAG TPA: DNA-protecting protein DprA [Candidatus Vogelbacteria bacterium]|nr:DNA-protecting protein DprA [Candidatus Vogelbacteria bacterium]
MVEIIKLDKKLWPPLFNEIPDPPKELYLKGALPDFNKLWLTIIGPRRPSQQAMVICRQFIDSLAGQEIVIVSGLAIGIDGLAHQVALENNLPTVAIPGSGLSDRVLYPARHKLLANKIISAGGGLLSEYSPETPAAPYTFPRRNRLMAGIAHKVLVIEAGEKSGTLITARLGLEYNKDILVVPGSIFSPLSAGTNRLIKEGAEPILSADDLKESLGFKNSHNEKSDNKMNLDLSPEEKIIKNIIARNNLPIDEIISKSNLEASQVLMAISNLEIKKIIADSGGLFHLL